jgi:hypothetical protein
VWGRSIWCQHWCNAATRRAAYMGGRRPGPGVWAVAAKAAMQQCTACRSRHPPRPRYM